MAGMTKRMTLLLFLIGFGLFLDRPASAYRLSCGFPGNLDLCGAPHKPAARYPDPLTREQDEYNGFQRLAGMIADRMEVGSVGNVKLKFKILL